MSSATAIPPFPGFIIPSYTPTPDVIFDELLAELSHAELRVLLYIVRRTFGFRKNTDTISYEQFQHGIVNREGERLDHGCGVTHATRLSAALKALEAKGYIVARKGWDQHGRKTVTTYGLHR